MITDEERQEIVEDLVELCEYREGLLETPPIHPQRRSEMVARLDASIERLRRIIRGDFCGDEQPHERHEYLRGVRRFECPGVVDREER